LKKSESALTSAVSSANAAPIAIGPPTFGSLTSLAPSAISFRTTQGTYESQAASTLFLITKQSLVFHNATSAAEDSTVRFSASLHMMDSLLAPYVVLELVNNDTLVTSPLALLDQPPLVFFLF
jgi:hypothetical protein